MRRFFILGLLLLFLSACAAPEPGFSFAPAEEDRLVIYTSHREAVYEPIIKEFEERTGVWVQVETGGSGDLLARVEAEAEAPVCDLFFGGGVDSLQSRAALFEPYVSPLQNQLQPAFRCDSGTWTAFSSLPVVLIYNPVLIRANPPDSWQSLLDPAWRGKIAFASPTVSGSSYTTLASLLQVLPEDDQALLEAFVENLDGRILDSSTQVADAVAGGSCYIGAIPEDIALQAIANGRDVALLGPKEGTCTLPDGMAVVTGCPHGDNARRFIDFALSEDVQRYLMDHCSRRSVRADLRQEEEGRFLAFDSFDYDAVWAGEQRETLLAQWRALCGEEGGGI
nr:extracellular solute-binding protein [uncultured Oscillibacter sp.]